jgi:outer membrane protein assembly factor BamD
MSLRKSVIALAATLALTTACTNKKVSNPLAKVDSKQPDKVLFDRGMDSMKHNHYDIARLDMQTLINTYPDSEFIARAKLAMADSWYAEGDTASLAQAEQEYIDFETFFPNMPEAAEAQLKVANIHFQQMEKPDRDFTHAARAEQEYRKVILEYPDNQKIVAEAKIKLMQVQEVIAEREFRVGHFYYVRQTYPAAIARLQSLVDRYPLYSKADETLYFLGQCYEGEIATLRPMDAIERKQMERRGKVNEEQLKRDQATRERLISDFTDKAAEAYGKILTRYPVMEFSDAAKARLIALHQPVPRPTKAALAQNKAEDKARRQQTAMAGVMGAFQRHPDVTAATNVGEPTLVDPEPISAGEIVQRANRAAVPKSSASDTVSVTTTGTGAPPPSQPAPRSDAPAADATATGDPAAPAAPPDPNELKPGSGDAAAGDASSKTGGDPNAVAAAPDPNELKPDVAPTDQPAPAPAQVNEIQQGASGTPATAADSASSSSSSQEMASDKDVASSKHKKKKGLSKYIPLPKPQ